ncbi:nuclear transport factor 2 family protein [Pseudonocardia spirodelae]|uniref:Nuclear transport factor 2 family protein n=1 Tax=Pseudonocardia spirodelae TaxID=3133431 RepID=A0ABU8T7C6_9PSEU
MSTTEVVESFYRGLAAGDGDEIGALIDRSFHSEVVLSLPPSLPYGGEIVGAHRLRRMFVGAATAPEPVGPAAVRLVSLVGDGQVVVAELAFDWYPPSGGAPVASGACEVWLFDVDGRVTAVRAYYRDTVALVSSRP